MTRLLDESKTKIVEQQAWLADKQHQIESLNQLTSALKEEIVSLNSELAAKNSTPSRVQRLETSTSTFPEQQTVPKQFVSETGSVADPMKDVLPVSSLDAVPQDFSTSGVCDFPLTPDTRPVDTSESITKMTRLLKEKKLKIVRLQNWLDRLQKQITEHKELYSKLFKENKSLKEQLTAKNSPRRFIKSDCIFPKQVWSEATTVSADPMKNVLPVSPIDTKPTDVTEVLIATLNSLRITLQSMMTEINNSVDSYEKALTDSNQQLPESVQHFLKEFHQLNGKNLNDSYILTCNIDQMTLELKRLPSSTTPLAITDTSSEDLSQTVQNTKDLILGIAKNTAAQVERFTTSQIGKEMTVFSNDIKKIFKKKHEELFQLLTTVPELRSHETLLSKDVLVTSPMFQQFFIEFYQRMETDELDNIEKYLMKLIPSIENNLKDVEAQIRRLGSRYVISMDVDNFEKGINDYIHQLQSQLIVFDKKIFDMEKSYAIILQNMEEYMDNQQKLMVQEFKQNMIAVKEHYNQLKQKQLTDTDDSSLNIQELTNAPVVQYPGITDGDDPNREKEYEPFETMNAKNIETIEKLEKELESLQLDYDKTMKEKNDKIRHLSEELSQLRGGAKRVAHFLNPKASTSQVKTNSCKVRTAKLKVIPKKKATPSLVSRANTVRKNYTLIRLKKELIQTKRKLTKQNDDLRLLVHKRSSNVSSPIELTTCKKVKSEIDSTIMAYFYFLYLKYFMLKYEINTTLPDVERENLRHKFEILNNIKEDMRLNELTQKLVSYIEFDIIGTQEKGLIIKKIEEYSCEATSIQSVLDDCMTGTAKHIEELMKPK